MKPRILSTARLSFPLASAIAALLAAPSVHGASGNWTYDGPTAADLNWSTATNWSSNPTVPGTVAGDVIGRTGATALTTISANIGHGTHGAAGIPPSSAPKIICFSLTPVESTLRSKDGP